MFNEALSQRLRRTAWEAKSRVVRALGGEIALDRHADFDDEFVALLREVGPYTMTTPERLYGLREATQYVVREGIPGDTVECGVWRGGSSMAIARTLMRLGDGRSLWMYDTFEGMSTPSDRDGQAVIEHYRVARRDEAFMAYASLDDVQANMRRTGFPDDRVHYVVGKVEDTIPQQAPERIALLRLDTDWYESTRHELEHLWDRLSPGGVLIIDDYGHWQGARAAVDGFYAERGSRPLFARMDYTGRLVVKPG